MFWDVGKFICKSRKKGEFFFDDFYWDFFSEKVGFFVETNFLGKILKFFVQKKRIRKAVFD